MNVERWKLDVEHCGRFVESPPVTFCVLTYGDYADLVQRAIESILKTCPRPGYRLIVGGNVVGTATARYLEGLEKRRVVDHLLLSNTNLNKGRMMRRMLPLVDSEFTWWFDDDSHITDAGAFDYYLSLARSSPGQVVQWGQQALCDYPGSFTRVRDIAGWVRKAKWFRGLPPPSWEPGGKGEFDFEGRGTGDGRWIFILGGCWFARTSALRALHWPDPRLIRYGEDVLLGEAIRQQGWSVMNTRGWGLAVSAAQRRGVRE